MGLEVGLACHYSGIVSFCIRVRVSILCLKVHILSPRARGQEASGEVGTEAEMPLTRQRIFGQIGRHSGNPPPPTPSP